MLDHNSVFICENEWLIWKEIKIGKVYSTSPTIQGKNILVVKLRWFPIQYTPKYNEESYQIRLLSQIHQ